MIHLASQFEVSNPSFCCEPCPHDPCSKFTTQDCVAESRNHRLNFPPKHSKTMCEFQTLQLISWFGGCLCSKELEAVSLLLPKISGEFQCFKVSRAQTLGFPMFFLCAHKSWTLCIQTLCSACSDGPFFSKKKCMRRSNN